MNLTLHSHPLASYCWKPLIALYDNEVAFKNVEVNLGDATSRTTFASVWPLLKFPVLVDTARTQTVVGSAVVIDYVDRFAGPRTPLIPADPDLGWQARMWDRLFDDYFQTPMQRIVADALRAPSDRDAIGVDHEGLDRERDKTVHETLRRDSPTSLCAIALTRR